MSKGVEVYAEIDHDGSHKKERLCEKSLGIMREKERLEKKNFLGIVKEGMSSYYTIQIIHVEMSSKGVSSNVVGRSGPHDGIMRVCARAVTGSAGS